MIGHRWHIENFLTRTRHYVEPRVNYLLPVVVGPSRGIRSGLFIRLLHRVMMTS